MRFERAGEALFAAYFSRDLAAVGGLTIDPMMPGALRMRRFYVRKRFRRSGVGRRLAAGLLDRAAEEHRPLTVNAAPGSTAFWQSLGFIADERDGHTHMLQRTNQSVCG